MTKLLERAIIALSDLKTQPYTEQDRVAQEVLDMLALGDIRPDTALS